MASLYAKRFCEEFPNPRIVEPKTDTFGQTVNYLLGPSQIWPAQLDSLTFRVSENHGEREMDYETQKLVLMLESPELTKRSYVSKEEYQVTIDFCFRAVLSGMKNAKLRMVVDSKKREIIRNANPVRRLFLREKTARQQALQDPLVQRLITSLKDSVEGYRKQAVCWGLG